MVQRDSLKEIFELNFLFINRIEPTWGTLTNGLKYVRFGEDFAELLEFFEILLVESTAISKTFAIKGTVS